jgi:hypothetical protein
VRRPPLSVHLVFVSTPLIEKSKADLARERQDKLRFGSGPAEYVRRTYNVPAKRSMRVVVNGRPGIITSFQGAHIVVRFDGDSFPSPCHPTWKFTYKTDDGDVVFDCDAQSR